MKSYNDLVSEMYESIEQAKQAKPIIIPKCKFNQHPSIRPIGGQMIGNPPNMSIIKVYMCDKCNQMGEWKDLSSANQINNHH